MLSNFDFATKYKDWKHIADRARKAEQVLPASAESAAVMARSAMELSVKWIYQAEGLDTKDVGYSGRERELFALLKDKDFCDVIGDSNLLRMLDQLRIIGNTAAHGGKEFAPRDGVLALKILYELLSWMAYCYTDLPSVSPFDEKILPHASVKSTDDSLEAKKLAEKLAKQDAALAAKREQLDAKTQELDEVKAENERLQKLLRKQRQERQKTENFRINPLTEAETRRRYIDYDLATAGWIIGYNCRIEEQADDMPNHSGIGFADYVLFGRDQKPLAVVEAKRTCLHPDKGAKQASLYADSYEKKYGRRPFIFLTNGFFTLFLDDASGYPRRRVSGFFTPEELQMLMDRRNSRQKLSDIKPRSDIAGRPYQLEAVKAVAEALDHKRRKVLVVQATGTGKTRVAISIVNVLVRAGWVKRALFLADRTELVDQGQDNFKKFMASELSMINLTNNKEDVLSSRLIFSTYPTMMNAIDEAKNPMGSRIFTPGTFDLIIIDESHRSIYHRYQAIFAYFDAILLGLTATPKDEVDKDTYAQFELEKGNPTFEYNYDEAIKAEYLVPFEQFERTTKILKDGLHYKDLSQEDKEEYEKKFGMAGDNAPDIPNQIFNKYVFNRQTVQGVLADHMDNGQKIDDGDKLGKTIIFAKNRKHAKFIVDIFHEMYPELGDNFIQQVDGSIDYYKQIIDDFRTEKYPQIAVSVDMLDTGIDVPEILNLVFFKMVRSYSKFWQMIGRGTRLCPNIFGQGKDKKKFYIFDYGGNFEYFSVEGNKGKTGKNIQTLTERIYNLEVNIFALIHQEQDSEKQKICSTLLQKLHGSVVALNDKSFRIIPHREQVEKYRNKQNWNNLTSADVSELSEHIAPIVNDADDDIAARRFDREMFSIMYDFLMGKDITRQAQTVEHVADELSTDTKQNIPQVRAKASTLAKVRYPEFWQNVTLAKIEYVRTELRELIKFLDPEEVPPEFFTDFSDKVIIIDTPHTVTPEQPSAAYKKKVERYLREHQDNLAVYKLRTNKELTSSDMAELERILWQELGSEQNYRDNYGDTPIGKMVRQTVGMDRHALEEVFAEFLQDKNLSREQIHFVRLIVDYLAINGGMESQDISRKPAFATVKNVQKIFPKNLNTVKRILAKAENVTAQCLAIG